MVNGVPVARDEGTWSFPSIAFTICLTDWPPKKGVMPVFATGFVSTGTSKNEDVGCVGDFGLADCVLVVGSFTSTSEAACGVDTCCIEAFGLIDC
jgi:hypothetical protein